MAAKEIPIGKLWIEIESSDMQQGGRRYSTNGALNLQPLVVNRYISDSTNGPMSPKTIGWEQYPGGSENISPI